MDRLDACLWFPDFLLSAFKDQYTRRTQARRMPSKIKKPGQPLNVSAL